ncbi:VWA domain-containing protein [Candidatus Methylospira mobilis]|uniref:VWA domain-containing protein n=1 Tax=Candidatus Methylospira mobilis TaxID=1808979 RepID=UPI0028EA9C91|nr:VWA domain-containing protein [Candidatus Methylospira mobilis]WNV06541.1 VWA domain-containing protein [Candidatus Methylospira mobilis]
MTAFHFIRPWFLLGLLPLAWFCWRSVSHRRDAGAWTRWCDAALLPHILDTTESGRDSRWSLPVFTLAGFLAVLALAGPAWERLPSPVFRNNTALVIVLDLSRTMGAADLKPSRLERARFKITDLLKQRKDGYSALVVYSGEAYTVTPLTDDRETIISQLAALNTDLLPTQGSRADLALERGAQLLEQSGFVRGDVLLITSGVNLTHGSPAAEQLRAKGYRLSVLGVGTEAGAPVPLPEGGFLQDGKGATVISRLAAPALQKLAADGGGQYRSATSDNSDLTALTRYFEAGARASGAMSSEALKMALWLDRGPWLLPIVLLLSVLGFRRGLLSIALAVLIYTPEPAQAFEWRDLWQTPDQQGRAAMEAGRNEQAADKFHDPAWKSAALYRANRYGEAAEVLNGAEGADAAYNRGNALAKEGKYQEALAAYDQALKKHPDDADARYNRDLVEKKLQEQQKDQKEQQKQDKSGSDRQDQKPQQGAQQDQKQQDDKQQDAGKQDDSSQGENKQNENAGDDADKDGKSGEQANRNERQSPDQAGERNAPASAQDKSEKQPEQGRPQESEQDQQGDKAAMQQPGAEDQQATEQWLRRIPDDPAGLLKRKFQYQYQQRQQQQR